MPVVEPLPDEPALAARVLARTAPGSRQPARAVAHRVRVLAQHERQRADARASRARGPRAALRVAADRRDLGVRGVHAAVDVDVRGGVGRPRSAPAAPGRAGAPSAPWRRGCGRSRPRCRATTSSRTRGSCRARPCARCGRGTPPPTPGRRSGCPASRRPRSRGSPGRTQSITQNPSSSASSSTRVVRRVVAGADRVDVVPLHRQQVRAGVRLVEHPPALGVGLVAVHAAEGHRAAVDEEPLAVDRHRAEPQPQRHGLARAADGRRRRGAGVSAVHGSTLPTSNAVTSAAEANRRSMPSSGIATVTGKRAGELRVDRARGRRPSRCAATRRPGRRAGGRAA